MFNTQPGLTEDFTCGKSSESGLDITILAITSLLKASDSSAAK